MYVENPAAWGAKRICQGCNAKYYDLCRDPAVCPKCGVTFIETAPVKRPAPAAAVGRPRSRARVAPTAYEPGPVVRRSGSHSPFAETRPAQDDDGGTSDDDTKARPGEDSDSEERETGEEANP